MVNTCCQYEDFVFFQWFANTLCYTGIAVYCFSHVKLVASKQLVMFIYFLFNYAYKTKSMALHVLHCLYTFLVFLEKDWETLCNWFELLIIEQITYTDFFVPNVPDFCTFTLKNVLWTAEQSTNLFFYVTSEFEGVAKTWGELSCLACFAKKN